MYHDNIKDVVDGKRGVNFYKLEKEEEGIVKNRSLTSHELNMGYLFYGSIIYDCTLLNEQLTLQCGG